MRQPGHQLTRASVAVGEPVAVQAVERDADGLRGAVVHRVAQAAPVGRAADPALLAEHDSGARSRTRASARGSARDRATARVSPSWAMIPSRTNWAAIAGVVEAGQEQRGWPRIRACRIIRSSTVGRWAWPRCSEPVTFGGGWMMVNGGSDGSAGSRRRRARRRPRPASARRSRPRRRGANRPSAGRSSRRLRRSSWALKRTTRSSSGRTGSWYHLLVRTVLPRGSSMLGRCWSTTLAFSVTLGKRTN